MEEWQHMMRMSLRSKSLVALVLPLFVTGIALAGGADCAKEAEKAAKAGEKGAHCHLSMSKEISKTAHLTDTGAVVTLTGKTPEAVALVKSHLATHEKGEKGGCADCPMDMQGVTATYHMTDNGGEVTFVATDKDTIKKVQKWAEKPAACCDEKTDKV
jgi:hypothetical protein